MVLLKHIYLRTETSYHVSLCGTIFFMYIECVFFCVCVCLYNEITYQRLIFSL